MADFQTQMHLVSNHQLILARLLQEDLQQDYFINQNCLLICHLNSFLFLLQFVQSLASPQFRLVPLAFMVISIALVIQILLLRPRHLY